MATGIDDEVTLRANREGFLKFQLRPRRLVDVEQARPAHGAVRRRPIPARSCSRRRRPTRPSTRTASSPSRAPPRKGDHLQILSTVATASIEDGDRGARRGRSGSSSIRPTSGKWPRALARRAEKAGAQTIVVTVDVLAPPELGDAGAAVAHRHAQLRARATTLSLASYVKRKPNFDGLDISGITSTGATNLTWEFIKRLRDTVKTRLVLKGLMTAEDAVLAVDNGLDGIIVSNHGGRAEDSGRSTIDALPEILEAVDGRIPVLVDSRLPPRHRHRQGAGAGRARRVHRPALSLGARRLRSAGRRARARPPAAGNARRHDAARRAVAEASRAGDGATGLSPSSPSLRCAVPVSNRNQVRFSVSSIQFSIRLAVAMSLCSSHTSWSVRMCW